MENLEFKNRDELRKYLEELLANLDGCYNIFLHEVGDYVMHNYGYGHTPIDKKAENILKIGLLLDEYGSICGTMNFIGDNKTININKILDYSYYDKIKNKNILVIAVPKYIEIDGKLVEFSSFNGKSSREREENLVEQFFKHKLSTDPKYMKFCLFDVIKKSYLEKYYQLSMINQDIKNNKYTIRRNNKHLSFISSEERCKITKDIEDRVKTKQEKYKTNDLLELIVQATKDEKSWWESKNDLDY